MKDLKWTGDQGSFRKPVEHEYGIRWGNAVVKIKTYETLANLKVDEQQIVGFPWRKLEILAAVLTAENLAELLPMAKEKTLRELRVIVEALQKGSEDAKDENPPKKYTYYFHEDQEKTVLQAIARAKEECGTQFDSVALEAVLMSYLGGAVSIGSQFDPKKWMTAVGYKAVLETFEQVYPEILVQAVEPDHQPCKYDSQPDQPGTVEPENDDQQGGENGE